MTKHLVKAAAAVLIAGLVGCQPTDRPTNLANTQALDKAKGVEGQMQQRATDGARKADEEQK